MATIIITPKKKKLAKEQMSILTELIYYENRLRPNKKA